MRVLVTGGAGFIGSNVVRELVERSHKVTVLDNLSSGHVGNLEGRRQVHRGDVRDSDVGREAVRGNEVVFHLAASVGNVRSTEQPVFDSAVNVLGTLTVLEAARGYGISRVVYSSSAAIFGEPHYLPIDEEHPTNPLSPYGVSKFAGERYCLCYSRLYDLTVVCLRYFNVYGINQRFDSVRKCYSDFRHSLGFGGSP